MWLEMVYWIDHVWSSIECVCCACGPSERLDAPSICFVCVSFMSEVISSFRILRTGPHVFALLMLFLCVICILLCLSAIKIMFVKNQLTVCMLGLWSERKRTLCLR